MVWMILLCILLFTGSASADSVTDSISVCIGYFGWKPEEYVQKASYRWNELDDYYGGALDTHEIVYSYYNGSRTYLALGRGFYIRDLLEYAGVDLNSIASVDFFTKDHTNGAYRSFTKRALFDQPRYYFPYLAANEETGELYAYDGGDDLWLGASRVEAMLAVEDYTQWDAVGCEFEAVADSSLFSTNSRFHLFFGQASPEEKGTSSAAKYVYKILVTFSGAPMFSAEETNLDLKVGSERQIQYSVSAEDELLDEYVREHMTWKSSNEQVVQVDGYGNVTVTGEGTAVVTGSYGSSSFQTIIRVGQGGESGGQSGSTVQQPESGVYIVTGNLLKQTESTVVYRGESLDADSTQLVLKEPKKMSYIWVWGVLGFFAILGYLYGVLHFKKSQ